VRVRARHLLAINAPAVGPQVARVVSLPQTVDELARRIEEFWSVLEGCTSLDDVRMLPSPRTPGSQNFNCWPVARPSLAKINPTRICTRRHWTGRFGTRTLIRLRGGIISLVAVHRLREVACLYGFTRFEPAPLASDDLEDVGLAVSGAPLARMPEWLPTVDCDSRLRP
jgi:hypothetical protein